MTTLEKCEIAVFGPYRFLGKTVYAPPGAGETFGGLWANSKEIFDALDRLAAYATEETNRAAYLHWDAERKLLGYTVGKFMRADAPAPEGMDAIDIPRQYVAKSFLRGEFDEMIANAPHLAEEAIQKQTEYEIGWNETFFGAEVYPAENVPQTGAQTVLAYYIPCRKKEQ